MKAVNSVKACPVVLALLVLPFQLWAQNSPDGASQADTIKVNLTSPYHTVLTHLQYLQEDNFYPEAAARVFQAPEKSPKEKGKLAIQLIQILDGQGLFVNLEQLPKAPYYRDSATGKAQYTLFPEKEPEIYLVREAGKWLYSRQTVEAIPKLHKKVYPYGMHRLVNLMPYNARSYLGFSLWQLLGLAILITASYLLFRVLNPLLRSLLYRLSNRLRLEESLRRFSKPMARPLAHFFIALIWLQVVPVLQLPVSFNKYLLLFLQISLPVFLTMVGYQLSGVAGSYMQAWADRSPSKMDDQLVPLVRKTLKALIIIAGLVAVLQIANVNVTALVTGLSIGGLAFALAAQDTIKNLFGSLTVFLDKPFQVGDWISFNGVDGTVLEVGFRTTRVRTFHDSVISVPNGQIANMTVDNYGKRDYRRYYTRLGVQYDTPPELLEAFVQGLKGIVERHPHTRKEGYHVVVDNFAASAIEVMFYIFFDAPSWAVELQSKEDINLSIIHLAQNLGVQFAFPTQTLHIENMPGQASLSAHYETSPEALKQKLEHFEQAQNQHQYLFRPPTPQNR